MSKVRVTKFFSFEMAHILHNYDGLCRNLHGHSYKLYVSVIGIPINDCNNNKNGMVVDFSLLKKIVKTEIVDRLDHSICVSKYSPLEKLEQLGDIYERHHIFDFQPTCENMVVWIAEKIKVLLPSGIELFSVRLDETASAYAEWYASDN
ncbi:MAG: 6-pyruvoyl trahydropterin synthase family protein [Bacteroidales bacterium]